MQVDIFSDVVCPWCLIGTRRLERVLAEKGLADSTEIRYRTFLLDPTTPAEGRNIPQWLKQKYGRDPAPMFARVEAEARASGIPLESAKQPMTYPTVLAHTLMRHALPLGTQPALARALFEKHHLEGGNISDIDTLVALATAHGFTEDRARALLADEKERAITLAEQDVPKQLGVTGAPFFVFDGKVGVSGAQPEAVFAQVIDELQSEK